MNILLIGSSLEDHINFNGTSEVKPGGIFYSAMALNNYISSNDSFNLVTTVRNNDSLFNPLYSLIDQKYFTFTDEIPVITLDIHPNKERSETYKNISGSLNLPYINFNLFDGILINMITGFDLSLTQLQTIRNNFNKTIYLDVHSLARGINSNMEREFRKIPDFHLWAKNIDIIQVNYNELFTISEKSNELDIAQEILSLGVKQLVITMDELGAKTYYIHNNEIVSAFVKALNVNPVNKVGCGDTFGAVYFYWFLNSNSVVNSLKFANAAAGVVTTYNNFKRFSNLNSDVFEQLY